MCRQILSHLPEEIEYQKMFKWLYNRNIVFRVARRLGAWRLIVPRIHRVRERLTLHRTLDGWTFSNLSSGPLAEDAPGRWQSYEEICKTYGYYEQLLSEQKPSIFVNQSNGTLWLRYPRGDERSSDEQVVNIS